MSHSSSRWVLSALVCVAIATFAGLGDKPHWVVIAISAIAAIVGTIIAAAIIIADAVRSKE